MKHLYIDSDGVGVFTADLGRFTERHKLTIDSPPRSVAKDPLQALREDEEIAGIVLAMHRGWLSRGQLRLARMALDLGRRAYAYWVREEAVERLDEERLRSYRHLWLVTVAWLLATRRSLEPALMDPSAELPEPPDRPVVPVLPAPPSRAHKIPGCGVYLRTDFWVKVPSGGSYGHTCYVAKALHAVTERLVCFMPHRYSLLDDYRVPQIVMPLAANHGVERALVQSTAHYYKQLRAQFEALRPAYVYERLCLGNYVGARLCAELGIPYIVEYNGSELSMSRSFGGRAHQYEDFYFAAEQAAFRQATLVSVISQVVKADVVRRGIDPARVLVNPNGADLDAYVTPPPDRRRALRAEMGFDEGDRVIAFTGTFGGWHGIDVLAAALPRIAARLPEARFLLIGDGTHKALIDEAVKRHRLASRVRAVGRVPQAEGARLLGAADVYVSPHSSHMVDSRFFGSPTKVFEYMAMGRGIVASDLEQIGEVLRPALRASDLVDGVSVTDQRAVLCTPGDVDDFVEATVRLTSRESVCAALGRNARQAVADHYSWDRHVERLWRALAELEENGRARRPASPEPAATPHAADDQPPLSKIETGDPYKDQVQHQWNNNPVGSQYVKHAKSHTLEWFLEVEAHRYKEYAPWMPEVMEFGRHAGHQVLEIGGGMGTDLAQFARHGAHVTDIDLSAGHLELARENFRLRGLEGRFVHHDAETLPFPDDQFDLVYSNGVIHHTPNTAQVVREIYRVLKPGGRAIVMVYAENSLHYWRVQVGRLGLWNGLLGDYSIGEIMSRSVEMTANDARPLVKVYTPERCRQLFGDFEDTAVLKRQLTRPELPALVRWLPLGLAGRLMGWNLVIKATKPMRSRGAATSRVA